MKTKFLTLKRIFVTLLLLIGVLLTTPFFVSAQENITLSLTPPFFQLTISPGEVWSSSIKVVNVNSFPLTLYASVVNFEASGETGRGKFTPLLTDDPEYKSTTLAGWIDVTQNPIIVEPGSSVKVPFSIRAPENASPGGHYAAILVGTEPIRDPEAGPSISVTSLISSLIFTRVSGDIEESGNIRELSTDKLFYSEPQVPLSLRFENTGNVHLLPQGEIAIFNMWGKERGVISVNQRTEFGNVLPDSIRNFSYEWRGEDSPLEAGRYRVVATLSFGDESRQNITSETSFWVVPIVPVLSILSSIGLLILVITWFIRVYIRRALGVEIQESGFVEGRKGKKAKALTQPLVDGVMDLRNVRFDAEKAKKPEKISLISYLGRYKLFFVFIFFVILASLLISTYFGEVLTSERDFEVEELLQVENYEVSSEAN